MKSRIDEQEGDAVRIDPVRPEEGASAWVGLAEEVGSDKGAGRQSNTAAP